MGFGSHPLMDFDSQPVMGSDYLQAMACYQLGVGSNDHRVMGFSAQLVVDSSSQ